MFQRWHDLLFAHWPVPVDELRKVVPAALPLDTFGGEAWVGVVPFRMSGIRARRLPPLPWLSAFPELNLRTYVTLEGKPGIYFFSLDAANPLAVAVARIWFHLPYFTARMRLEQSSGQIRYTSRRIHKHAPPAELVAEYGPTGAAFHAEPGTLEQFLAERYCLYTTKRGDERAVYRCEIHHPPWPLQPAQAGFQVNTVARASGVSLPETQPLLHFSRLQDTVVWPLERVKSM